MDYIDSVLFKCKILQDVIFAKEIIAIKRKYQTKSEQDKNQTTYGLITEDICLPSIQYSNNPKENILVTEIRHLSKVLTTTINGENKLFYNSDPNSISNNSPEKNFLQDLDRYVEENPNFLRFIHRNERSKESISYIYYDENEQKHSQHPDYILRTKNNTTIICEIKTASGGFDYINSVKNIENGYLMNSKEIPDYFFGIIKHKNYQYQLVYYKDGKKVPVEFLELKNKFPNVNFDSLNELSVLFGIIKAFESLNKT